MEENELIEALQHVFGPAVEMQRLAAKCALSTEEAAKLFGLSKSMLDHLRIENRGPKYTRLSTGGKILYTPDAIRQWLDMQNVSPRAI